MGEEQDHSTAQRQEQRQNTQATGETAAGPASASATSGEAAAHQEHTHAAMPMWDGMCASWIDVDRSRILTLRAVLASQRCACCERESSESAKNASDRFVWSGASPELNNS